MKKVLSTRRGRFAVLCSVPLALLVAMWARGFDRGPSTQDIALGEELFLHEWTVNDPLSGGGDGLGPVFNARACVTCHSQGGIGGSGTNEHNVLTFEVDPGRERDEVIKSVVHASAISDEYQETPESVQQLFPIIPNAVRVVNGCSVSLTDFNPVHFEQINSPALFGAGLLDEISDFSILMHNARRMGHDVTQEFKGNFEHNGQGFARTHANGRFGRFGWKGQFATLREFVANACAMEIGLTNPMESQPIPREHNQNYDAKPDMTRKQLDQLVAFVKSLPAPEQVLPDDPDLRERALHGKMLFEQVKCNDCHVENLGKVQGVYTDFKLYSLERSEAGNQYANVEFERPGKVPLPTHWQTPPLWGVADSAPYFHDGAAETLSLAITRHFGQAKHSRELYLKLSKDDQKKVVEFLQTLRAPQNVDHI